jgi:hypothetical protein
MKKMIAIAAIMFCVAGSTTAFARGYNHGGHSGYDNRSHYSGHRGHRNDGVGIAVGIMGGLLLGSALVQAASPPPAVMYQPEVVVQPSRICVEDRRVNGEWQVSRYDGRRVWVSYPYPAIQRVRVPCY